MFNGLRIALDMGGCPNKCRHCYLGITKSNKLSIDDLDLVYELFNSYAKKIAIYSWYKEPDFLNNYQELYEIEKKLSDEDIYEKFELASIYRLNRDPNYAKWLKQINVKKVQVTFFGLESNTNYFTNRPNAFKELLNAIEILIENQIVPKIQLFINKKNINELNKFMNLIEKLKIKERVEEFGEFIMFAHLGTPTGENLKNICYRITEKDLKQIPEKLYKMSETYLNTKTPFGISEHILYEKYIKSEQYIDLKSELKKANYLGLYINYKFDCYPTILSTAPYLKLGNLKQDSAATIIENYLQDKAYIFQVSKNIKIKDLVKEFGNQKGIWLFEEDEYLPYLLELYCIKYYQKQRKE